MKQIITHLTDTDFYKYTMGQWILHRYPNVRTHWKFKIRTAGVQTANLVDEVNRQLDMVANLRHTKEELEFLQTFLGLLRIILSSLRICS